MSQFFSRIISLFVVFSFAPALGHAGEVAVEENLRRAFADGKLAGVHSVQVLLKEELLVDVHFPGEDQRWGTPLGKRQHGPDTLHDLRSVTKSVVGLLYGIALADGFSPGPDESLLEQFPEYGDLASDAARAGITIGDVLSMQMGTEWNDNLSYRDPKNSEIAMENAQDRYRFILDRPMVSTPGEGWNYNGGATAIIAKLIAKTTGMPIDDYARVRLFEPLGITRFEWVAGADGEPSAASGLRLSIRDLVKLGTLVSRGGRFDGRQIVPSTWIQKLMTPRASASGSLRYGYFWWLASRGEPPVWVAGFGNGGQRLTVQPKYDLVIAIFAGNYNQPDDWELPVRIIEEYLVPGLRHKIAGQ